MGQHTVGYVRVTLDESAWKTPDGESIPWYEVRTDLIAIDELEAAVDRVLAVYGVSDVVVDAFRQFHKELPQLAVNSGPAE